MDTDAHSPLTEGHDPPTESEATPSPAPTAELTSIIGIMLDMMAERRRQDEERRRYEEENERRIHDMNKQMKLLERMVKDRA